MTHEGMQGWVDLFGLVACQSGIPTEDVTHPSTVCVCVCVCVCAHGVHVCVHVCMRACMRMGTKMTKWHNKNHFKYALLWHANVLSVTNRMLYNCKSLFPNIKLIIKKQTSARRVLYSISSPYDPYSFSTCTAMIGPPDECWQTTTIDWECYSPT